MTVGVVVDEFHKELRFAHIVDHLDFLSFLIEAFIPNTNGFHQPTDRAAFLKRSGRRSSWIDINDRKSSGSFSCVKERQNSFIV